MASLIVAFDLPGFCALAMRCLHILKIVIWIAPRIVFMALSGSNCQGKGISKAACWGALVLVLKYLSVPFDQSHGWGSLASPALLRGLDARRRRLPRRGMNNRIG
jgi:hypothetical protein